MASPINFAKPIETITGGKAEYVRSLTGDEAARFLCVLTDHNGRENALIFNCYGVHIGCDAIRVRNVPEKFTAHVVLFREHGNIVLNASLKGSPSYRGDVIARGALLLCEGDGLKEEAFV